MTNSPRIADLKFLPRQIIRDERGAVFHMLKTLENDDFTPIGEIYFSAVREGVIKGWKRHKEMTQRLVVPIGAVRFYFFDARESSSSFGKKDSFLLSPDHYGLLLIPPLIWYAFEGCAPGESLIVNASSMAHNPTECEQKDLKEFTTMPFLRKEEFL